MRKILFIIGMLTLASCINEEYDDLGLKTDADLLSDDDIIVVPDDSGDTGDSGNSGNSGNSGDSGNSGNSGNSGDSGDSGDSGNSGNSGNTGSGQECGNGIVETGEICDKNSVKCSDLDSNFESGMAECKETCTSWDTTNCIQKPEEVTPLAVMPARSFEVEYLYNGAAAFNQGANQENELWAQPLFQASIPLTTDTYHIPHYLSDAHWLAGFYDSTTVQFVQQSFVYSTGQFTTPYVVMGAAKGDAVKDAVLKIGIKDSNEVNLIVVDIMYSQDCVILVGYGTLTVNSVNLVPGYEGDFTFTTSKIDLYLPKQTPEGNVVADIQNAGFAVCQ